MLVLQAGWAFNFETFHYIFISFYNLLNNTSVLSLIIYRILFSLVKSTCTIYLWSWGHNKVLKVTLTLGLFLWNEMCYHDSENHEGNSMFQTLHAETNFLETNFLKKTYFAQFSMYNLYKQSSQGTWPSAEKKLFFLSQRLPKFLC